MKKITIYECVDKTRFDKKADAERYEEIYGRVEHILDKRLGIKIQDRVFVGKLNPQDVRAALAEFMIVCADAIPSFKFRFEKIDMDKLWAHGLYKTLSDYASDWPVLWNAYYRFLCINPNTFNDEYSLTSTTMCTK
jgi:hypothetical protein